MNETHTICHITLGHNPTDDRIFYKEIISLKKQYEKIVLVAPDFNPPDPKYTIDYRPFPDDSFFKKFWNAYTLAKQVKADLYHFHEFEFLPFAMFLKFKYNYLTYFPARAKESTTKIMNIPKKEYSTTSSVTLLVFSSCWSSKREII